jgi:YHS domain-containing protein
MRKWLLVLASIVVIAAVAGGLFLGSLGMFADEPIYTTDRGAIDGYDAVAFFEQGAAVRGDEAHAMEWRGSRWLFASAENLERFRLDPERFAPEYGGYCAYGMANGYTAYTDPNAWTIVDGRLFLNFDADVKREWEADRPTMIDQADRNWPESRPARSSREQGA